MYARTRLNGPAGLHTSTSRRSKPADAVRSLPRRATLVALVALAFLLDPMPAAADVMPWEGTFTLRSAGLADIVATGSGIATVNGSGGGAALSTLQLAGGISGAATISGTGPVQSVRASFAFASGTFALGQGAAGGFGGSLPLSGSLRYCLVGGCGASIDFPLTNLLGQAATTSFLATRTTMTTMGATSTTTYGATGTGWAVGEVALAVPTSLSIETAGFVHTPASLTNAGSVAAGGSCTSKEITNADPPYWSCTNPDITKTCTGSTESACFTTCSCSSEGGGLGGSAVVTFANLVSSGAEIGLVTPFQTFTTGTVGSRPFAAALEIQLVPEPGILAGIAAGVGVLTLVGLRGRGRRPR